MCVCVRERLKENRAMAQVWVILLPDISFCDGIDQRGKIEDKRETESERARERGRARARERERDLQTRSLNARDKFPLGQIILNLDTS